MNHISFISSSFALINTVILIIFFSISVASVATLVSSQTSSSNDTQTAPATSPPPTAAATTEIATTNFDYVTTINVHKGDVAALDFYRLLMYSSHYQSSSSSSSKTNSQDETGNRNSNGKRFWKMPPPGFAVEITKFPHRGALRALNRNVRREQIYSQLLHPTASHIGKRARRTFLLNSFRMKLSSQKTFGEDTAGVFPPIPRIYASGGRATSVRNLFLYETLPPTTDNMLWDAYTTSLQFRWTSGNDDVTIGTGLLRINVINTAPEIPPFLFRRSLQGVNTTMRIPVRDTDVELCGWREIKSVVIVSMGWDPGSYDGDEQQNNNQQQQQQPPLGATDPSGQGSIQNDCTIRVVPTSSSSSSRILNPGMILNNNELVIRAENLDVGRKCVFTYFAVDASGARTRINGTVLFKTVEESAPFALPSLRNYWPRHQPYVLVPLTAFSQDHNRHALSFFITKIPDFGSLYVLMKMNQTAKKAAAKKNEFSSSSSYVPASGPKGDNKVLAQRLESMSLRGFERLKVTNASEAAPFAVVTNVHVQRIYVLYVGPPMPKETDDFKTFFHRNDTFTWFASSPTASTRMKSTLVTIRYRDSIFEKSQITQNHNNQNNQSTNTAHLRCGETNYRYVFWNRPIYKVWLNYSLPAGDSVDEIKMIGVQSWPHYFGALYETTYSSIFAHPGDPNENKGNDNKQNNTAWNIFASNKKIAALNAQLAGGSGGSGGGGGGGKHNEMNYQQQNLQSRLRRGKKILKVGDRLGNLHFPRLKFFPEMHHALKLAKRSPAIFPTMKFAFSISTRFGQKCVVKVMFNLLPHDGGLLPGNSSSSSSSPTAGGLPNVFFDTAPFGRWSIFALGGNMSRDSTYLYARIVKAPRGKVFTARPSLPYESNMTAADVSDPSLDSYCQRHACSSYRHRRLFSGDYFWRITLTPRGFIPEREMKPRFWLLYEAPPKKVDKTIAHQQHDGGGGGGVGGGTKTRGANIDDPEMDSFTIAYCTERRAFSVSQCAPEQVQYNIFLQEGNMRRIYVPFTAARRVFASTTGSLIGGDVTEVPIRLGDARDVSAMVLDFDKDYRHSRDTPPFSLWPARRDGSKFVIDGREPLKRVFRPPSGITGKWVMNSENTLILIPDANTQFQNFRFRARLFNRSELAKMPPKLVYEDVRVIAVRRNSPPRWPAPPSPPAPGVKQDPSTEFSFGYAPATPRVVTIRDTTRFSLNAIDDDNDQLTFIVTQAPRHGNIYFQTFLFQQGRATGPASTGFRFRPPRGTTDFRTLALVVYHPTFERNRRPESAYPVNDTFTIVADDGGDVPSAPITIFVQVVHIKGKWDDSRTLPPAGAAPTSSVGGVVIVLLLVAVAGGVFVFLRRRWLAKKKFQKLAEGGVGQAHADTSGVEMT